MPEKKFIDQYLDYVKICMNEKGIYPFPGFFKCQDDKLIVSAFAVSPEEVYKSAFALSVKEDAKEFAFGLDRFNKKGQGIDMRFKSVFTVCYFVRGNPNPTVIVIPYNSPDDCGEYQYNNQWWQTCVHNEMEMLKPGVV